jgi:hypothetical protein
MGGGVSVTAGGDEFGQTIRRSLRAAWRAGIRLLRECNGDASYETYLARGGHLGREAFYLDLLQRKYSNPSRCC